MATPSSVAADTPTLAQLITWGRIVPDFYGAVVGLWDIQPKEAQIAWMMEHLGARLPVGQNPTNCVAVFIGLPGVPATKVSVARFECPTSHLALRVRDRADFEMVLDILKGFHFDKALQDLEGGDRVFYLGLSSEVGFAIHLSWRSEGNIPKDPAA